MTRIKEAEIEILFKLIEDKTGYTRDQLKGPRGKRELTHVRRAFFAISRNLLKLTYEKAGGLLDRDHSTVHTALKKHDSEVDMYDDYGKVYKDLYKGLEALYITRTEFSEQYIQARIDILTVERSIIAKQIDRHQAQLDGMDAGKK